MRHQNIGTQAATALPPDLERCCCHALKEDRRASCLLSRWPGQTLVRSHSSRVLAVARSGLETPRPSRRPEHRRYQPRCRASCDPPAPSQRDGHAPSVNPCHGCHESTKLGFFGSDWPVLCAVAVGLECHPAG